MQQQLQKRIDPFLQHLTDQARPGAERLPTISAIIVNSQGILYQGASGKCHPQGDEPMTVETLLSIFSLTKLITSIAIFQLIENEKLDLDRPVKDFLPELRAPQILTSFDEHGRGQYRQAIEDITTTMLLNHTAGFGYEFFNRDYAHLVETGEVTSIIKARKTAFNAPLFQKPGTGWSYGTGHDWAGRLIEEITGQRLGNYMAENLFSPLGMDNTAFELNREMANNLATIYQREQNGALIPWKSYVLPPKPRQHMGGHGLYSTAGDFAKILIMLLNMGQAERGRILSPPSVERFFQPGHANTQITPLESMQPLISNRVELFPGLEKQFSYGGMITMAKAETGRPKGSFGWSGFANLYYWIDRTNDLAGLFATQLFPFMDQVAYQSALDFETMVYQISQDANQ